MLKYYFSALVYIFPLYVAAYEVATHARITHQSHVQSILSKDPSTMNGLGLYGLRLDNPFNDEYYDISDANIIKRNASKYATQESRMPSSVKPLSIEGWLMRGAIREDDLTDIYAENPQDDPYGDFHRVLHHFYDPVNDKPLNGTILNNILSGCGGCAGTYVHEAVDWALGVNDAFLASPVPEMGRRNHFSILDAKEAMYRALTGRSRANGSDNFAIDTGGAAPVSVADKEKMRKAYWATAFRSLGDVLHIIQDMAQPQHTRNEAHSFANGPERQVYEEFTNQRILNRNELICFNRATRDVSNIDLDGYPVPDQFGRYSNFFSTRDVEPLGDRKGIADFSNREFFTPSTGINTNKYPSPPDDPLHSSYTESIIIDGHVCVGDDIKPVALRRTVEDKLNISTNIANVPVIARGFWPQNDQGYGSSNTTYSLINHTYEEMANILLPRAVAYGAGLLDYFFRGRMEITAPDEGVYGIIDHSVTNGVNDGFTKIKLKLRNTTSTISGALGTFPQDMSGGELRAVAKFRRNPCYDINLGGEIDTTSGLPINGCDVLTIPTAVEEISVSDVIPVASLGNSTPIQYEFDFSAEPIPINATDLFIQVVYRGVLGAEQDAVVVATKDMYEPGYLTVSNSSDYILVND